MIELFREIVSTGPAGVIALLAFAAFALAWKALSVLEENGKQKRKGK